MVKCRESSEDDIEVISVGSDHEPPHAQLHGQGHPPTPGGVCGQGKEPPAIVDNVSVSSEESADEEKRDNEGTQQRPGSVPFPAELSAAKSKLARCRRCGDEVAEAEALLALAQLKLDSGRCSSALALARDARGLFGDDLGVAKAVWLMVRVFLEQDRFVDALRVAEHQAHHFQASADHKAEATIFLAYGDVHRAMGRHQEAVKAAAAAEEIFKRAGDGAGAAAALQMAARVNLKLGSPASTARALQSAEAALGLAREAGDPRGEAAALLLISRTHFCRHEYEDAFAFARGSVEVAQQADHKKAAAAALTELASMLLAVQEDPDAVVQVAQEAVEVSRHIGDWLGEIAARRVVAKAYQRDGLLNFAFETMEAALVLARKLRNRRQIREVLDTMADIQTADVASALMEDEVGLARACGDTRREAAALQKAATIRMAMDGPVEALQLAEQAVELLRKAGDKRGEALAMRLVAELHGAEKRYAEALGACAEAKSLLQDAGDVKGAADMLQFVSSMHSLMGSDKEAVRAFADQRSLYKAAGWREEEAEALLQLAGAHFRTAGGPKEACQAAKDAAALYHDLQDKAGEAAATLALANFQLSTKGGHTESLRTVQAARQAEALRTVKTARQLFKSTGDAHGEAQALQVAADVYLAQGDGQEAVRATREALAICQRAGDRRGEADALRAVATVHVALVQKDLDDGLKPDPAAIQEALGVTSDSLAHFQAMGDTAGHASALLQLARLYLAAKDGEAALQCARESLEIAEKLEEGHAEASALLTLAEAHVFMKHRQEAHRAAEGAKLLFADLRDAEGLQEASRLCRSADDLPAGPEHLDDAATLHGSDVSAKGAVELKVGDPPAFAWQELPMGTGDQDAQGQWSSFAESWEAVSAAQVAAEQRRLALLAPPQLKPRSRPDQDLRRRQLLVAAQVDPGPGVAGEGGAGEARPARPPAGEARAPGAEAGQRSLSVVLQAVRPDWTSKDLWAVQDKLAKLSIETPAELFQQLRTEGVHGVNTRLKAAGQKCLRVDTLEALRDYGEKLERHVDEA